LRILGTGLGAEKGAVLLGDVAIDMTTAKWADDEVTVYVSAGTKQAKVWRKLPDPSYVLA
jgi:hypothetical protein